MVRCCLSVCATHNDSKCGFRNSGVRILFVVGLVPSVENDTDFELHQVCACLRQLSAKQRRLACTLSFDKEVHANRRFSFILK